jgi:hypothetical protein
MHGAEQTIFVPVHRSVSIIRPFLHVFRSDVRKLEGPIEIIDCNFGLGGYCRGKYAQDTKVDYVYFCRCFH